LRSERPPPVGLRQALGDQVESLRGGAQVPVRIAPLHMPQGRRERRQVAVDVDACPISAPQRLDGATVAKIVSAWPMAVTWPPQADLAAALDQRGPYRTRGQAGALRRDENARGDREGIPAVAQGGRVPKRLLCGGRQWETAGLAQRGGAHGEEGVWQIDSILVQCHEFADPHARDGEQAEHGDRGAGAQPRDGGEGARSLYEPGDLGRAGEIRRVTLRAIREQGRWGTAVRGSIAR
jgi:hypothetical protein